MKLAKDGIFPITKDRYGNTLPLLPASNLDIPGTIQGEGKLCGIPSLFIRLAGCNLRCCWTLANGLQIPCDTAYAAYELKEVKTMDVEEMCALIFQNTATIRHLVITGGEPLLQATELKELCIKLKTKENYHITLETNATLFDEELAQYIDLFSLSPKLFTSQAFSDKSSISAETIQAYIQFASLHRRDFQLKFVYADEKDIQEIQELLLHLQGWQAEDILLMPLGATPALMRINSLKAFAYCIRNGWRYCDRLHISLFGNKTGL